MAKLNKRVLIIQTWGMGDLIMMLPMLKKLKNESNAQIDVVVTNRGSYELCKLLEYVDDVFLVNLRFSSFLKTASKALPTGYECTILGYGSGIKQILLSIFLAPLSKKILVFDDKISHRVINNLAVLNYFKITSKDESDWRLQFQGIIRCGILIHPGSGKIQASKKRPSIELIKKIHAQFVSKYGPYKVRIVFGPDEVDLVEDFAFGNCIIFETVAQAIKTISESKLLVTGDTGYGHLAALVDTPVITLAGPTDVQRTRPYSSASLTLDARNVLSCIPCYGRDDFNTCPNNRCMSNINPNEVMSSAKSILMKYKN